MHSWKASNHWRGLVRPTFLVAHQAETSTAWMRDSPKRGDHSTQLPPSSAHSTKRAHLSNIPALLIMTQGSVPKWEGKGWDELREQFRERKRKELRTAIPGGYGGYILWG